MIVRSFSDLITHAKSLPRPPSVVLVCADDEHSLGALTRLERDGVLTFLLAGTSADPQAALAEAVEHINAGRADAIMKGSLTTSTFLRAVLKSENNLRGNSLLSAVGLYEMPSYHKIFAVTDFAMNTTPDLAVKRSIIENAVALLHKLGIAEPRVAVLSEAEHVNPKIQASIDAAELKRLNEVGEINGCIIEGPISIDLAMNREAVEIKGYKSPVAADADLLVMPDVVSGNLFVKSLTMFGGAVTAGTIPGAKIPVIMTSRSSTEDDKYYSIALAAIAALK